MIPKSKVLVLPSFYPIENDFSGNFFEEQARLINKSGLVVSVIYDEKRSLKHFSFKLFKNHYFQVTRSFEENVPVYRRHSWNIVPFRYSLGKYIWIKNTINLCEKYFREVGVPKLIHVHCALYAGEVALYLFEKYKIPFIITEHSTQFYEGSLTKNDISKLLPIYLSANKIIVVSSNFKYFLSEYLSIDLGRISVVPNFIDTDYFNPNALPANPIVKSQNIIFTVCNHNKRKRLDRLIEAFYSFKKQKDSQNWILYIGGSGPETSHLKNLCLKYNLETSIFFVGQLNKSQVRFYLNSSKFFVLSSDYETFGVVLIEAISMGKPVVSTRSGGVNDIVAPWNGILVDNNSQGLANGILLMASNYLNYNNKMVRSMGIKLFSGYAVANKYLKYYNEV